MGNISAAAGRVLTRSVLGASKTLGFPENPGLALKETMASRFRNLRMDQNPPIPVSVSLSVRGMAPLSRFTNPEDKQGFLAWFFQEGSHVTIPGLADRAPVRNGYLQILWYRNLVYYYEFTGSDGTQYIYRGSKNLRDINQFRAWTTLYGGVYEAETGKKIIDSTTVFGETGFLPKGIRFLLSFKLRKA